MKAGKRAAALSLALVGTLMAAYFAPSEGGDGVMLTAHAQQAASSPAPMPAVPDASAHPASALSLSAIAQRDAPADDDGRAHWTVMGAAASVASAPPPSAQPKPAPQASAASPETPPPPPPPQAPALPFKWLGWAHADGQASAFLQYQDQNLVVKVGDRIDGRYSVERIDADALTFVYLPLNEAQTLNMGSGNRDTP